MRQEREEKYMANIERCLTNQVSATIGWSCKVKLTGDLSVNQQKLLRSYYMALRTGNTITKSSRKARSYATFYEYLGHLRRFGLFIKKEYNEANLSDAEGFIELYSSHSQTVLNSISTNNTILDCAGYEIFANGTTNYYYGILNKGNNNTIKNCVVSGFRQNIKDNNNYYYPQYGNKYINNILSNGYSGISIAYGQNSLVMNNTFFDMKGSGLNTSWSGNLSVVDNTFYNNNYYTTTQGIIFDLTGESLIMGNILFNNSGGIYLRWNTNSNNIANNIINNNIYGITTQVARDNNFTNNIIDDNGFGMFINADSYNNIIWNNTFVGNNDSASDLAPSHWNLSNIGNYWDDFEENQGYPSFYRIQYGGAVDFYPVGGIPTAIVRSEPVTTVKEREVYFYDMNASYPNIDLKYHFITAPSGMEEWTTNDTINWTPGYDSAGEYEVEILIDNGIMNLTHNYTLTIENTDAPDFIVYDSEVFLSNDNPV